MSLRGTYDPEANIAYVGVDDPPPGEHVVTEETEGGLRDRDGRDGRLIGVEVWSASERLPVDLLNLLPPPSARSRR